MKDHENRPGTIKNQLGTLKNHKNPPRFEALTIKNQPVTLKNQKYPPGAIENQRGTLKTPKNPPGTMKSQHGTLKSHKVTGGQVVTGDSKEEVIIFRYKHTNRQTLHQNIYITIIPITMVMTMIVTSLRRRCSSSQNNVDYDNDHDFAGDDYDDNHGSCKNPPLKLSG